MADPCALCGPCSAISGVPGCLPCVGRLAPTNLFATILAQHVTDPSGLCCNLVGQVVPLVYTPSFQVNTGSGPLSVACAWDGSLDITTLGCASASGQIGDAFLDFFIAFPPTSTTPSTGSNCDAVGFYADAVVHDGLFSPPYHSGLVDPRRILGITLTQCTCKPRFDWILAGVPITTGLSYLCVPHNPFQSVPSSLTLDIEITE